MMTITARGIQTAMVTITARELPESGKYGRDSNLTIADRLEILNEDIETEAQKAAEASHDLLDRIVEASGDRNLMNAIEALRDEVAAMLEYEHAEAMRCSYKASLDDYGY